MRIEIKVAIIGAVAVIVGAGISAPHVWKALFGDGPPTSNGGSPDSPSATPILNFENSGHPIEDLGSPHDNYSHDYAVYLRNPTSKEISILNVSTLNNTGTSDFSHDNVLQKPDRDIGGFRKTCENWFDTGTSQLSIREIALHGIDYTRLRHLKNKSDSLCDPNKLYVLSCLAVRESRDSSGSILTIGPGQRKLIGRYRYGILYKDGPADRGQRDENKRPPDPWLSCGLTIDLHRLEGEIEDVEEMYSRAVENVDLSVTYGFRGDNTANFVTDCGFWHKRSEC